MTHVYQARFRCRFAWAEDQTEVLGTFSTAEGALAAVRAHVAHEDDEAWILEITLDVPGYGATIWNADYDRGKEYAIKAYAKYWA